MAHHQPTTMLLSHAAHLRDGGRYFLHHHGLAHAGNMAFLAMLAIVPFIIFLVTLSGLFGQTQGGLAFIALTLEILPPDVAAVLKSPIQGILDNSHRGVLAFSILITLWTAVSGVEAARQSLLLAFDHDDSLPFWRRRLESLIVVMIAAFLVLVSISIQAIGPPAIKLIMNLFPESVSNGFIGLWTWLRYLISPLALFLGLFGLYAALTPRCANAPYKLPGALIALIVFLATAMGLSAYLEYVGTYNLMYGSLTGVVVLQLFCFLISIGFILGAEVNASYARQTKKPLKD